MAKVITKEKVPMSNFELHWESQFLGERFSQTHKALKVNLTNYESFKLHFRHVFGRVVHNFTLPEWQGDIMAWYSAVWFEISALFGRGQSLTSTCLFHPLLVVQTTEAACWCFLSYRWTLRTVYPIVLLPTISFDNWNQQIRNRNCRTFNDAQENYLARNLYRNKTSVFITSCFVLSNRL